MWKGDGVLPAVVIVGPPGVGKTDLWLRIGCDLSVGELAIDLEGTILRLSERQARDRFGGQASGASKDDEGWANATHGVRRLRLLTQALRASPSGPASVLWLVDGPGLSLPRDRVRRAPDSVRQAFPRGDPGTGESGPGQTAPAKGGSGGRDGVKSACASLLMEQVLLADALIHVRVPSPTDGEARLERALRDLAATRGIDVLSVRSRRPGVGEVGRSHMLGEMRWRRDLKHVEQELMRRFGQGQDARPALSSRSR